MDRQVGFSLIALLLVALDLWLAPRVGLTSPLTPVGNIDRTVAIWEIVTPAFILGVAMAAAAGAFARPIDLAGMTAPTLRVLTPIAIVVIALLLGLGVVGKASPIDVIAFLLATFGVLAGGHAFDLLRKGEPIGIEQHWGGLGGGGGGWTMSPTLVASLICAASLLGAGALLLGAHRS